jgi:hypothetical protein
MKALSRNHQLASNDRIIEQDQAALVVRPDGCFRLLFPEVPGQTELSFEYALIVAIALKMDDPEWVEAMMSEFVASHPQAVSH